MSFTTIHFDASDYCGTDFDARRVKLWATNNAEDETIHDPDGHVYIGSGNGTIAADGQASITVPVPEAGWNPITCQTTLHLDYPDRNSRARNGRETKTFGPFTVPEGSISGLITNVALTSNVASLTTSAAHGLRVGYTVTVSGDSAPFNGTHVITEVTSTVTFKCVIVAANVASRAAAALFTSNDIQLNDLVEEQTVPPEYAGALVAQLEAIRDEALAGGGGSLTVVSGGTVDLDDTKADGFLVGYKVTATTTIEGVSFAPGSYIFERDSTAGGGWTYRTLDAGDSLITPDTTAPTAPTLTVDNSAEDELVATFSGGTDAVGVTQYRTRIDGGAWTVGASPRTFAGLTASTSYTIDAQAGDAAGNWSVSDSWTGSTAAAAPTWTTVATDDFTGTDATTLIGRTTTTGGLTWSAHPSDAGAAPIIQTNKAAGGGATFTGSKLAVSGSPSKIRVTADYDVSAASSWAGLSIGINSGGSNLAWDVLMRQTGATTAYYGSNAKPVVASGQPTTGTLTLEADIGSTTITVKVNGSTIGTTTIDASGYTVSASASVATRFFTTGGRIDNLTVETFA
ncbi:MAG: hypothetical protein KA249_12550 [Dermatophilaceae bacterium]|nr:hypothetical protein [Dermatophilaceae bacterium]